MASLVVSFQVWLDVKDLCGHIHTISPCGEQPSSRSWWYVSVIREGAFCYFVWFGHPSGFCQCFVMVAPRCGSRHL